MPDNDIFMSMSADNEVSVTSLRELRVLSGLHQGAALTLSNDTVTVGSDTNCTVVLLDEGVSPLHATLCWIDGVGWAQAEAPGLAITNPLRVGPVWLSIVAPHTPWVDLDQLLSESASTASASPADVATVYQAPAASPHRRTVRWALSTILVSSALLLVLALNKQQTPEIPTPVAATAAPEGVESRHTPPRQAAMGAAAVRALDNPSDDVLAVVNGNMGFVLMRNGQRVYLGESVGGFVLIEIQGSTAVWRFRSSSIDTE